MDALKQLKKYPIMVLFMLFIGLFALADMVAPKKDISELENRALAQAPPFDAGAFFNNQWTKEYGEYVKDQFLLRDEWISLQSVLESGQGKLESGGVWFAKDGYQIAKNDVYTPLQQQTLPANTQAVCELAARHPGKVTAMVVPSPANVLADQLRWNPPQYDENEILNDMYAQMADAGATVLDLRETYAKSHAEGTPLFYKTDHHWTTDGGALLAYNAFCESEGRKAIAPPKALKQEVPGFLGTNYAKTKHFGTQPDTITYYDFDETLTVFKQLGSNTDATKGPLMDKSKFDSYDKYGAFLRGNNGYSEITGEGEGSILLIKDSYGNAFAPFLTQNYAKIGIIDLRSFGDVDKAIAEGEYDSVLVLYSFNIFATDSGPRRMMTSAQG